MARRKKYNNPNQMSLIPLFNADAFMEDIKNIIAQDIVEKGRSATGNAVKSLRVVKNGDDEFQIFGASYMDRIEKGNPPNKSKRAYFGRGRTVAKPVVVLVSKLQQGWLQARGLPLESAWAIAHSIIKNGDRTYQKGGEDVWSGDIDTFIANNLDEYLNIEQYVNIENL